MSFTGSISLNGMTTSEPQISSACKVVEAPALAPEQPSFELLIHQHQAKLFNFIYRYTRSREDAEDLLQDTFIKAFRNFDRYDSQYTFSAWLYTIARRTVCNHYRRRRPTESLEFEIVDPYATPDTDAEAADAKQSIWALAKKLKPEYQEVLILKYTDDLSIIEIAQVMGKSLVNIKTLLFRARHQLRKLDHNHLLSR